MGTGYLAVTAVTALVNAAAAVCDFTRSRWVLENMTRTGLTESWFLPLGVLKAAGAVGLVVGIAVPALGAAAAVGLVLYFAGAIVAVVRVRWYAHVPFPAMLLALAAVALALRLVTW